ncbi:NAD(P)-binding protein [Methylocella tundrae]
MIGAGLAGLAAAVRLAGGSRNIIVYEAARQLAGAAGLISIRHSAW